jgi:hypothetical protein
MNRTYRIALILPLAVLTMAAQEDHLVQRLQTAVVKGRMMGITGAVMGAPVKGAPYSGVETSEHTQALADGTRIDNKTQTNVARDSEGRVRRETPDQIMIWDPVANASYLLDPKAQTAQKMPMPMVFSASSGGGGGKAIGFSYVTTGAAVATAPSGGNAVFFNAPVNGGGAPPPLPPPPPGAGAQEMIFTQKAETLALKSESLGQQMVNGVNAEGTRTSSTIEAGAIGNDRPIQITGESWYSTELQTLIRSVHSDPRMGQDTFQLINISRGEPSPDLFQVPPGYQVVDRR